MSESLSLITLLLILQNSVLGYCCLLHRKISTYLSLTELSFHVVLSATLNHKILPVNDIPYCMFRLVVEKR